MCDEVTVIFPGSKVTQFMAEKHHPALRRGQAFYNYMDLHKITSRENKVWCDKLHAERDKVVADRMIFSRTDWEN